MPEFLSSLPQQQRLQVLIGAASGIVAALLYAAKAPAPPEPRPTVSVWSVTEFVQAGTPLREEILVPVEVPLEVAMDYLPTDTARGQSPNDTLALHSKQDLLHQKTHLDLSPGARLTSPMFWGGLGADHTVNLPDGYGQVSLKPIAIPDGASPGSTVDLYTSAGRLLLCAVPVVSVDPFTVALPTAELATAMKSDRVKVVLRRVDDPQNTPKLCRPPSPPKNPAGPGREVVSKPW